MKASNGPLLNISHKEIAHLVLQIKIPAGIAHQIETLLKIEAMSRGAEVESVSEVRVVKRKAEQCARSAE